MGSPQLLTNAIPPFFVPLASSYAVNQINDASFSSSLALMHSTCNCNESNLEVQSICLSCKFHLIYIKKK